MSRVRAEEEWARRILAAALNADVSHHDTGLESGMYDLEIRYPDGRGAAAEVVAAADGETITLWRLMNDKEERWQVPYLVGGWIVVLEPRARARRIHAELPHLLKRLEDSGIRHLRFADQKEKAFAQQLRIVDAIQSGTAYRGSIYVTIDLPTERSGGMVSPTIAPLVRWVGTFLASEYQADVRRKLSVTGACERHAVLFVPSFSTVAFPVMDVLMRNDVLLSDDAPELPPEITDVWAFSSWTDGLAFHWSRRSGWESFRKL